MQGYLIVRYKYCGVDIDKGVNSCYDFVAIPFILENI